MMMPLILTAIRTQVWLQKGCYFGAKEEYCKFFEDFAAWMTTKKQDVRKTNGENLLAYFQDQSGKLAALDLVESVFWYLEKIAD
jgi:hypothetical protein